MAQQDNSAGSDEVLSLSVCQFIEATAARQATPGGGSVAGVVGSLAAALGEMALNFTTGKKLPENLAEYKEFYEHLSARLGRARIMFAGLVSDDMQAFSLYREASRMDAGPEKAEAVQLALAAATDVPREMAKLALALLADLAGLAERCNPQLISDVKAGAALAVAVLQLSHYNVQINIPSLDDAQAADDIGKASQADLEKGKQLLQQIEQAG